MFESECEATAGQHIPFRFETALHNCFDHFRMLLPLFQGYDFFRYLIKRDIVVRKDAFLKIDKGLIGF